MDEQAKQKTELFIKNGQIFRALSEFQGEAVHPKKIAEYKYTVNGKETKRTYAPLDECIGINKVLLAKCGLSVMQFPFDDGVRFGIITILAHKEGDYVRSEYSVKPERDSVQGAGSVFTYLRRYAYNAALGLASEDDDDAESQEPREDSATAKETSKTAKTRELTNEERELFQPQVLKTVVDKINKAKSIDELNVIWKGLGEAEQPNYVEVLSMRKSILKANAESKK